MRISSEEWEKMDWPVSVREIYGQMQEVNKGIPSDSLFQFLYYIWS